MTYVKESRDHKLQGCSFHHRDSLLTCLYFVHSGAVATIDAIQPSMSI